MSRFIERMKQHVTGTRRSLVFLLVAGVILATLILVSISVSVPDTYIRVTSFEPSGQVGLTTNLTVKFSKAMVPPDSVDRPVLDPPLKIIPPVPGMARWIQTDVLRFFPDGELHPATNYTVQVQSDRTWASGFKITDHKVYTLRTPPLRLDYSGSWTEQVPNTIDSVRVLLRLTFNYPVNLKSLAAKLSLEGQGDVAIKSPKFTVQLTNDETRGTISGTSSVPDDVVGRDVTVCSEPLPKLKTDQRYNLKVGKGLLCEGCGYALTDPLTVSASVERIYPLTVSSVQSYSQGENSMIAIDFSNNVDPDDAKAFITVEPHIDYTLDADWSRLIIRAAFNPGETYTISIAKGLRSKFGNDFESKFSSKVKIADLSPSVSFTSRGIYLPKGGGGLMEFKTINIQKVAVEVEQVFANNLVYFLQTGRGSSYDGDAYYYDNRAAQLGRSIFIKDKSLDYVENKPLLTTVDIKSIIGDTTEGIFKIAVRQKEQRWIADSRYVMVTDLGLSARFANDYLMVWVNSLSTVAPVSGVTVTLFSKNNQTLLQGKTDGRGIAIFKDISARLAGFEPFVITAERAGDLSYLRLDESLLPVSDFDVAGRPLLTSGYEAMLYPDRGVYRPGDTAHLVSIVRGSGGKLPPPFPYALTVFDPQGKKFTSFRMATDASQMSSVDFIIPDYVPTGRYGVAAMIGDELQLGRTDLLVEEFMPDRIKVELHTPKSVYRAGDIIKPSVNARLLFGPPAAGYQVRGSIVIESQPFTPERFPGFSFSSPVRSFNRITADLRDTLLSDSGTHTFTYAIPDKLVAPSALKGLLSTSVSEPGGRAVGAYTEVVIHPYTTYLGLKLNKEGYAKPGQAVSATVLAVTSDGQATALDRCRIRFDRVVYNTLFKRDKTVEYHWVSERKVTELDSATLSIPAEGASVSFTPTAYGDYEITALDPKGGHAATVDFWASGWGYAPWAMDNPDRIDLALDKSEYQVGDKAVLQVRAPFGGKLLVTLEQGQVIDIITRDMPENTAELQIPVKKEYLPNIYVTAAVVRPGDSLEPNKPARAFGIVPLKLGTSAKRLGITIVAPEVIKPHSRLIVGVQLDKPKVSDVTIAAVDAGILQLTDFATPDPLGFFYGKKAPHFKAYDLYSFLYPRVSQANSHLAAGDRSLFAASRQRHLNPFSAKRVKPVALWSGVLHTDANGRASTTFDVPEFNGKLVVMTVSAQGELFGSAAREVTVRDNIVVQESFPRFISPRDVFDGLVTVYNNTGHTADIVVALKTEGPVSLEGPASVTIPVENGKEGRATFRCKAGDTPGKVSFAITAASGSDQSQANVELTNRPALPIVTLYGSGVATKDKPAQFTLPGDWIPTTEQFVVQTSGLSLTELSRNIDYLLRYPYGCVEQTTSRIFPLLYYDDLVRVAQPDLFGGKGNQYFIQEGITRLSSMMLPDRSFSFWPGSTSGNPWSTIYASHFLSEASRAGYVVDKKLLANIYDNMNDIARGRISYNITDVHRVYAAYVLAQAGKLDQPVVSYLKRIDQASLPAFSRYQLAGVMSMSGNAADALKLLPTDIQPNLFEPESGGDFNSGVRTDAIALDVMLQVTPGHPAIEVLANSLLQRAQAGHWYTTQENAFALMALGKYFKGKKTFSFTGKLTIDGDETYAVDSSGLNVVRKDLGGRRVDLSVSSGEGSCFYFWQASGIPINAAPPEFDRGLHVRRVYLDENGSPIDLTRVHLGDQVIAVVSLNAIDQARYNVVINDLLPAGLEIENPRLKTTPRLSWVPAQSASIAYQDIRDDRLLLFSDCYPGDTVKFYYSLRAVSAGEFKVPPVAAECMYNPLVASSSSSGAMTITR